MNDTLLYNSAAVHNLLSGLGYDIDGVTERYTHWANKTRWVRLYDGGALAFDRPDLELEGKILPLLSYEKPSFEVDCSEYEDLVDLVKSAAKDLNAETYSTFFQNTLTIKESRPFF